MKQKYSLYSFLFEEAPKRQDLRARLKKQTPQTSPSGKIELHPHLIITGIQDQIKKELPVISQLIKDVDPSKQDVENAQKAIKNVNSSINAIAGMKDLSSQQLEEPNKPEEKPAVRQPVSGTANTEPAIPARQAPKTQQFSTSEFEAAQKAQADLEASRARAASRAAALAAPQQTPTQPAKSGLFQNLRNRLKLEEDIKQAVKAGLKQDS